MLGQFSYITIYLMLVQHISMPEIVFQKMCLKYQIPLSVDHHRGVGFKTLHHPHGGRGALAVASVRVRWGVVGCDKKPSCPWMVGKVSV